MLHEESQFTTHDGLEMYMQSWRPEDAPKAVLVVVHGLGEHSGRYANFAEWFVPQGYAVYAFDLRGHGQTPGVRGYANSWADIRGDVGAFLVYTQQPNAGSPIFLIGHSMGGLTVLDYALNSDTSMLRGVVASGPALGAAEGISPVQATLLKLLNPLLPKLQMSNGLDINGLARDPEVIRAYRADPLVHGTATPRLAMELFNTMTACQAHANDWPTGLPLLIVHGGADPLCNPQASARFFANAGAKDKVRHEYDDYMHEVFNEIGRETVLQDVQRWVEKHL